jgi:uncharacterized protein DUF899
VGFYVNGSLQSLITAGEGQPNGRGRPRLPAGGSGSRSGAVEAGVPTQRVSVDLNWKVDTTMKTPPIVTPREWEAARQQLLVKEKEVTRARDALAAERRRMPWLAVEKEYAFDGPGSRASLLDLFEVVVS